MTLMTFDAVDALAALLQAAALPVPVRNDKTLQGFSPSSIEGVGWKLCVNDEGWSTGLIEMGEPPSWEIGPQATIVMAVEGEPGSARDTVFRGAMKAIRDVLFPGGVGQTVEGKFEDLQLVSDISTVLTGPSDKGEPPVMFAEFTVSLSITAPTPFG